jgi:hypothetical protein
VHLVGESAGPASRGNRLQVAGEYFRHLDTLGPDERNWREVVRRRRCADDYCVAVFLCAGTGQASEYPLACRRALAARALFPGGALAMFASLRRVLAWLIAERKRRVREVFRNFRSNRATRAVSCWLCYPSATTPRPQPLCRHRRSRRLRPAPHSICDGASLRPPRSTVRLQVPGSTSEFSVTAVGARLPLVVSLARQPSNHGDGSGSRAEPEPFPCTTGLRSRTL